MNSIDFTKLEIDFLANKCLYKSEQKGDYWFKCSLFVRSLRYKIWENLNYKQVNWLQNIIDEV